MARFQKRILFWLGIILLIGTAVWYWRQSSVRVVAPQLAICPGPDAFGYRCESGFGFSYIDATENLQLYGDEEGKEIQLPFPFQFYGHAYESVIVGVNGTVHFTGEVASYESACLIEGILQPHGDFLAVYWEDLDNWIVGEIEYQLVGEEPNRIFVIEWDQVPLYGQQEVVSFEVQLLEAENQIVFLYQQLVAEGEGAIVGIQSVLAQNSLQYSCFRSSLFSGQGLQFRAPEQLGYQLSDWGLAKEQQIPDLQTGRKGALFLASLNQGVGIDLIQLSWSQKEGRRSQLISLSDERDLIIRYEEIGAEIWVVDEIDGRFSFLLQERIGERSDHWVPKLVSSQDITKDGLPDFVFQNERTNQLLSIYSDDDGWQSVVVPLHCDGGVRMEEILGRIIIRGNQCVGGDIVWWDGMNWRTNHQ